MHYNCIAEYEKNYMHLFIEMWRLHFKTTHNQTFTSVFPDKKLCSVSLLFAGLFSAFFLRDLLKRNNVNLDFATMYSCKDPIFN